MNKKWKALNNNLFVEINKKELFTTQHGIRTLSKDKVSKNNIGTVLSIGNNVDSNYNFKEGMKVCYNQFSTVPHPMLENVIVIDQRSILGVEEMEQNE